MKIQCSFERVLYSNYHIWSSGSQFFEDKNVIDLFTLDREQAKLPDAQKINIFVNETFYLAIKWILGNQRNRSYIYSTQVY